MTSELNDALRADHAGARDLNQHFLALYRLMAERGALDGARQVEYRCRRARCLLARVCETPMGPFVYQPAFRYSREAAARQTADGQQARPERAYALSDDPVLGGLPVVCPHHHAAVAAETVHADLAAAKATGRVERRLLPDGHAVSTHAGA
jgi:hypothetical protein